MTEVFLRLLSLSLSGTLIALVILALCALLGRRLSRTWRYYVWLIVLVRMVAPFAWPAHNLMDSLAQRAAPATLQPAAETDSTADDPARPLPNEKSLPVGAEPPENPADTGISQPAETTVQAQEGQVAQRLNLREIARELWQYAWVVWLGVALLLLVRVLTSYHSFTRFIRAGWKPVDDPEVLDALEEARQAYGLKRPIPLYLNPLAASPMLVGILRPVIVLPALGVGQEELRYVLSHELVHYKRGDILYKWFVQVVACLHWFNPILYLIRRDVHMSCELSCDEQVLSRLADAEHRRYGDTLLAVMQTSGQYGDVVASITMSEEGKMMKKRLHSIVNPYRRSWLSILTTIVLSLCLIGGATYAGAYTGASGETPYTLAAPEPVLLASAGEATASPAPATAAPTKSPTPGERLDRFLGDVGDLSESFGDHAKEWGESVAEKAGEWAQDWDWDWEDTWEDAWDWVEDLQIDDGMFSSLHVGNTWIINEGYYGDGYILHLKYNATGQSKEEETSVLAEPAVLLPSSLRQYAEDEAFLGTLQGAVQSFRERNPKPDLLTGTLQLVSVAGPYDESPDALLEGFYSASELGRFVAVLNSGLTSPEQRESLLRDAAGSLTRIPYFAILLEEDIPQETVDALLQEAYESKNIATYGILLAYASPEAKQHLADQAAEDGSPGFLAATGETPDAEAIDAILEGDLTELDAGTVALIVDQLTEKQALRIAEAAYQQDDIGVFSIVMDALDDEDIEAFHERAHQDKKTTFYVMTED